MGRISGHLARHEKNLEMSSLGAMGAGSGA